MFFELHDEKRIGYKRLSAADLGVSPTSHQTHIGLTESVLTFLADRDTISEDSIFIYQDKFEYIDAYFDRIENPNGSFRSPKIRIGERSCISVVSTIRNIATDYDSNYKWFLIWFGLKNSKIVFFLFNNHSTDYNSFKGLGLDLNISSTHSIDEENILFIPLMNYIEQKVNNNGEEVLKELEIKTQTEYVLPDKKFRAYDIDRANENIKRTGRDGEKFVNQYFLKRKKLGHLLSFTWYNEEKESGLPYDFSIQDNRNNIIYLDVKTTGFNFEQEMVFSSQEINYIATTQHTYFVYRVYKNEGGAYSIKICDNFKEVSISINKYTNMYSLNLNSIQVGFKGAKFAISPTIQSFNFDHTVHV
jgi:hypothetical protein